jgi:hypothetical protein
MGGIRRGFGIARHKRKIEKFKAKHPEGRKAFAKAKRRKRHLKRLDYFKRKRLGRSVEASGLPPDSINS